MKKKKKEQTKNPKHRNFVNSATSHTVISEGSKPILWDVSALKKSENLFDRQVNTDEN